MKTEAFFSFADRLERACAHPLGFMTFVAWCVVAPTINVDVANYVISVATAGLLFLTLGAARRDRKAAHTKLDDLECAIEEADSNNAGIEALSEAEIEARKVRT